MLESANPSSDPSAWVIEPELHQGFLGRTREVWQYRHTLSFFALQSLQTLYAKTHLGAPWLFIRTLLPLIIGSWVFGDVMQVSSGSVPYFIFFNTGQLAWNFFDGPLIRASRGLAVNRELLSKLYIPRIILPLAQMTSGIIEPLIMAVVLFISVVYYRMHDGVWYVHATPKLFVALLATLQILVFALALSFWTSVWQARARDVRYILRYVISFWLYVTPVIYPIAKIPASIRWLAYLNPLTAPVEMFKWAVLPNMDHSWGWSAYSVVVTAVTFVIGAWYFGRAESATVDRM